ncbi:hypothetical protein Scani_27050 [Streptomyces caniferus]|uniref:Uncharacterized protein n=1 Tax=Streptomyces caniferus TaxID=285557 RepID=A0A640S5Y6_9ACTN|nr:hypothetical protein Scani_27050 [Streptomyces caniferus]
MGLSLRRVAVGWDSQLWCLDEEAAVSLFRTPARTPAPPAPAPRLFFAMRSDGCRSRLGVSAAGTIDGGLRAGRPAERNVTPPSRRTAAAPCCTVLGRKADALPRFVVSSPTAVRPGRSFIRTAATGCAGRRFVRLGVRGGGEVREVRAE